MKTNCDSLIQRLNQYLDGNLPPEELRKIRQTAKNIPECTPLLETMIWAHEIFTHASMVEPSPRFSQSVIQTLKRQQRRDKIFLGIVLVVIAITVLAPVFLLLWTGVIVTFQPGVIHAALSAVLSALSIIAAFGVAFLSIVSHIPQWSIITLSTLLSVSFLLLALVLTMAKEPHMLLLPNKHSHTI